ncbi:pyrimidine reductase family protein [Staphylococcus chromogenes]|nr:pyrimidine reductase family protein [Staphylococcus chromogenes]
MDVLDLLGPPAPVNVPEVRAVAITSLNGRATNDGVSGTLGSELDVALLHAVRAWADVIIVGAGTVRAEDYGAVTLTEKAQASRRDNGQSPLPRIAAITSSLNLDPQAKFFRDTSNPPVLLTDQSAPDIFNAEVVHLRELSPRAILDWAVQRGWYRIALEGGPSVYGQWLDADQVDVLHLSIAPWIVDKAEPQLFPTTSAARAWDLEFATHDAAGLIFTRYRRVG